MRVYEFAKEHGLASKDLITLLKKEGHSVASHMSVLSADAITFLKNKYEKKAAPAPAVQIKVEQPKKEPDQQIKEEKKVLSAPNVPQGVAKKSAPSLSKPDLKEKDEKKQEVAPLSLASYVLSDLANILGKTTGDIILTLLKWGIISNKNQILPEELVERIAKHYEIPTQKVVEKAKQEFKSSVAATDQAHLKERLPVAVVMGHVDHGKTTLLDFIRKTRVAAREKGGITQHLGAYEATTPQGNLVFIDTPGHEAFSKIRIRGTKVADIVILVVAADDGIMPQTIEALKHAQSMNVPIIVAINKIDKVEKARIDIVKRELGSAHNLLPEEWGGQTMYIPISAKTGQGVDKLLEMIILQSQLMELQAQISGPARGFVLESKLEKGRGPVATVLTQHGLLSIGDYFVAGKTSGKISSMNDSLGQRVTQMGPSHPVQIAGFNELPDAGDFFETVQKDAFLKTKHEQSGQKPAFIHRVQTESAINLLVKTDTNSSKEALLESIAKISKNSKKGFAILHSAVGNVNESDVMLAHDTGARIITLHVKSETNAALLAGRMKVSITSFDIIYKLLEYLQEFALSLEPKKMVRTKIGEAIVRKVFDIKNLGVIAGAYVKQGIFTRDGSVIIFRGNKKVGEGKIISLQRDKNTVKEVHTGFECAFMIQDFKDWAIDDRVECYQERAEK